MTRSSTSIGVSIASTLLLAIMPKCPLCWIGLMSAVGVSWPISSGWLRSFVMALLLVPLGLLVLGAHRSRDYRPLLLGMVAAVGLYVCKFRLGLDAGVYLSGAALFGATLWSAKRLPTRASESFCRCNPLEPDAKRAIPPNCASASHTSSEVLDG